MRARGARWYFTPLLVAVAAWALLLGGGVVCVRMTGARYAPMGLLIEPTTPCHPHASASHCCQARRPLTCEWFETSRADCPPAGARSP